MVKKEPDFHNHFMQVKNEADWLREYIAGLLTNDKEQYWFSITTSCPEVAYSLRKYITGLFIQYNTMYIFNQRPVIGCVSVYHDATAF